ncbi:citryl-CoA lyase [Methylobacterium nodulans]|uniref:citrate synthase (unknown stereospecificity) n=1 Tax=Methylobacterium nodulans (strain LMG 21967 / CNCM I-2342 / ORS 2060) TaxID=460265 RepID=B8IVL3_METNO|nr:citryl-CoA lyase [Methylobacterium nodulans]ACL62453.1 citrate synthase [Methylobacterium nodulans ORS 2060]
MADKDPAALLDAARTWWSTEIIDMKPGVIRFRGYPIEQLIGAVSFPQMIWLMLRGSLPSLNESALLEAALVAAVDHGPQAPSIAISRMAVTCGLPLNGAMASAINVLDDVHGGAGEQCMELYADIARHLDAGLPLEQAVEAGVDAFMAAHGKIVSGFGHRFHPVDPRAPRLLGLVEAARERGVVSGRFAEIGRTVEALLQRRKGRPIPMNIDGATAVIYAELGFSPPLGRGLFILSRSVGILAHAWEQTRQGGRIKGPMPPSVPYSYTGPAPRDFPG